MNLNAQNLDRKNLLKHFNAEKNNLFVINGLPYFQKDSVDPVSYTHLDVYKRQAYCGNEAYQKIKEYSGYDLKHWTENNIDWANDFNTETTQHLTDNHLLQYLLW